MQNQLTNKVPNFR